MLQRALQVRQGVRLPATRSWLQSTECVGSSFCADDSGLRISPPNYSSWASVGRPFTGSFCDSDL